MEKAGIYVYAVSEKKEDSTDLINKKGLKLLSFGNLQLVYKKVDPKKLQSKIEKAAKNLQDIKKLLTEHEKVVEELSFIGTVIPFRFGTVLKGAPAALRLIKEKSSFFNSTLKKLRGKEEWGVKLYKSPKKMETKLPQTGTEYLMKIKEQKGWNQKALETAKTAANELMGEVKDLSAKVSIENTVRAGEIQVPILFKSSFLIERRKRRSFKHKLFSFKRKYEPKGVNLEISGPWPPYSFV